MRVLLLLAILAVTFSSCDAWRRRRRRRCSKQNCRVSNWSGWSGCNQACGRYGTQSRRRSVSSPAKCGGTCPYSLVETRRCNTHSCRGVSRSHRIWYVARAFSPLVYLHKNEAYRASDVNFFLRNVKMVDGRGRQACHKNPLTARNLCQGGSDHFLTTKVPLRHPSATNAPVLKGQWRDDVEVYAVVKQKSYGYLDIFYWMFYPYNRGKRVCIGRFVRRWGIGCIGGYSTFGHHVGDWEHVSIRIDSNLRPVQAYMSSHNFGTRFYYDKRNAQFRNGGKTVLMHGTHPVYYSAHGSHGMWLRPGRYVYKRIFGGNTLVDYTNQGHPWRTWKRLQVVQWGNWNGNWNFLKYKGRWGNKKRGCSFSEKLSGECILNDGPSGILSKGDMYKKDLMKK